MNTLNDADIQSALRLNPIPNYNLADIAIKASRVAIQVSSSIIFIVVYYHLNYANVDPVLVLVTSLVTSAIGYVLYRVIPSKSWANVWRVPKEHVQVAVVYLVFAYLLAPTLRTLTDTISTDTIHVTAIFMICLHLVTSDYGMRGFLVSKPISVNAAVIGSIFLASRLDTDWDSIALLTFAVQSFVLFPVFSVLIRESAVVLSVIILFCATMCMSVSPTVFLAYAVLMFVAIIICPMIFILSCGLKRNIYGPWDEAIPEIKNKQE